VSDVSFRRVVFLTAEALVAEALVMDLQVLRCPLGTSRHSRQKHAGTVVGKRRW
jgi:hypothetical protein